jgi:putative glutamine amidotransferase
VGRPLIAVPAYPRLAAGRVAGWSGESVGVPARYIDALRRAGAREAVFLPQAWSADDASELLDRVDGLLLVGGGDLDPSTYGADRHDATRGVDADRDTCELTLVEAALARRVPTLAICRGHQVLAVARGGVLTQDLVGQSGLIEHGIPGTDDGAREHDVVVAPDSLLAAVLGTTRTAVSSHHHQAVARAGPATRAVGHAPDGVIEALEVTSPEGGWVLGVQWHPEDTAATDPVQQRLFDGFVGACTGR